MSLFLPLKMLICSLCCQLNYKKKHIKVNYIFTIYYRYSKKCLETTFSHIGDFFVCLFLTITEYIVLMAYSTSN